MHRHFFTSMVIYCSWWWIIVMSISFGFHKTHIPPWKPWASTRKHPPNPILSQTLCALESAMWVSTNAKIAGRCSQICTLRTFMNFGLPAPWTFHSNTLIGCTPISSWFETSTFYLLWFIIRVIGKDASTWDPSYVDHEYQEVSSWVQWPPSYLDHASTNSDYGVELLLPVYVILAS